MYGFIKALSSEYWLKSQFEHTRGYDTFFANGTKPATPSSNSWFPNDYSDKMKIKDTRYYVNSRLIIAKSLKISIDDMLILPMP